MIRAATAAAFLASLLAAATCSGAIHWLNQYEPALELAKKTGRPMVLVFSTEESAAALKGKFEKPPAAAFQRYFLYVFLAVDIKNNSFFHPLFYKYNPGAGSKMPVVVFADATEAMLGNISGTTKPEDWAAEMQKALKKHGPPADARKMREAEERLKRATALMEKKEAGAATRLYQEIIASGLHIPAVETAKKELGSIEDGANKQLASARSDVEAKAYEPAVAKLLDLQETFPTLAAGKDARQDLARLRTLPEAKAAFDRIEKREAAGEHKAIVARHTDDPKDVDNDFFTDEELDALDRMAGGAPPEPAARPAASASTDCQRLLSLARSWIANKQPDKAKEILRRVVRDYPSTLYADQAKTLLDTLE